MVQSLKVNPLKVFGNALSQLPFLLVCTFTCDICDTRRCLSLLAAHCSLILVAASQWTSVHAWLLCFVLRAELQYSKVHWVLGTPCLAPMAFGLWCWILLPDVPPIGVCDIDPGLHHCLKDIDVHLLGDSGALREPVWRHPIPITADHAQHHCWCRVLLCEDWWLSIWTSTHASRKKTGIKFAQTKAESYSEYVEFMPLGSRNGVRSQP